MIRLLAFAFFALMSSSSFAQVVINEVYGGGGNSGATYKNDFVELFNNGTAAVDLAGWSVQYASASGTTWQVTNLSGSIPAKGYFLIKQSAGTGGTTELTNPDVTGSVNLAAGGGKVVLISTTSALTVACPSSTQYVDFVGYGTANCFEGTAATPAPSNTTSVQRTPQGFDSNQNGSDFTAGTPTPTGSNNGVDTNPPLITSLSPANNAGNVAAKFTATLTFNENVQKGTGNIVIKKLSDNSTAQTVDVTSPAVNVLEKNASFTVQGLAPNTTYYIEVSAGAFKDAANNDFAGISGTGWKFTTSTKIYEANFNYCASSVTEGFQQYSVTGAQLWGCTSFGRDSTNLSGSAPNGVQINGYDATLTSNVPNEDWLISPAFDLSATTYPLLTFWSRTAFNGNPLQLKVSTNYSGTGDPGAATWTDLNGRFPNQGSDVWTLSSKVNLSAFKQANVYVAFVYTSSNEDGARWTLDDISIDNSATPPPPSITVTATDLQLGYAPVGNRTTKTFKIIGNDITGDVTITATNNFLVSADGTNFSPSITLTQAEANNVQKTIFVKFQPSTTNENFTGTVTITTSGLTETVTTKATSIDPAITLEVVNWNVEWFGSTANGPTNEAQQEQNVRTIMQNVGADIYALTEVVDTARLGSVVRSLTGYSFVVSNFGSHTNTTISNPSPLGEAQKLAFVYKTSMFNNISTTALLSQGINTAADASSVNYNNWASGRYPYLMNADVTLNGVSKNMKFILIHAKANTSPTTTSYNRRKAGIDSLYDLLNRNYSTDNIIMLGDFNDDLDQTITAGINPPTTSYISFVNDSVNYPAVTLPLSRAGKKSTAGFSDMIDHVILSNEMRQYYMNNTATVLNDVTGLVAAYSSSTSDHYPIFTRYAFEPGLLPVILTEFTATKQSNTVDLNWKTAQETNSKEFVVERSKDAIAFQPIGRVNAAGTSSIEKKYSFTDQHPFTGNNYYRLKQVDKDGKSISSKIENVFFGKAVSISLSPNPAKDFVVVSLNNIIGSATLQIINNGGQMLRQQIIGDTTSRVTMNVSGLSSGVYLLRVLTAENKVYTATLLIGR